MSAIFEIFNKLSRVHNQSPIGRIFAQSGRPVKFHFKKLPPYTLAGFDLTSPEGSFLNEFSRLQKSLRLGNVGFQLSSSLRTA
jgi:hypothetical protein